MVIKLSWCMYINIYTYMCVCMCVWVQGQAISVALGTKKLGNGIKSN